jgi:hypothetical protein
MLGFVLDRKHWGVAKMLIAKTAKPDDALGDVVDSERPELVQAVLDRKPSPAAIDRAYAGALEGKHAEIADLLKKAGAHEPAPPVPVDPAVLASYVGTYRSEQIPVEVKVTVKEGRVYLQAAGQPELATKAVSPTRFAYAPAQLEIEFDGADGFTLKQGNGNYKFKKAVQK